jgi:multidrug efflux system outer membrane protein
MKLRIILLSVAALLTTGCTMGPRYKRPTVAVPSAYRGEAPEQDHPLPQNTAPQIVPLGDEKWWDVFQDEQLRTLIRTALQQNYD